MSPTSTVQNTDSQQLENLAEGNSEVLCTVRSTFPFDFFPSTIVVTRDKVDIIDQLFFFSQDISSLMIREIGRVEVSTSLFFSTIFFRAKTIDKILKKVTHLKKSDALKVQSVIQGLLIAKAEQVDVSSVPATQVESATTRLGNPLE